MNKLFLKRCWFFAGLLFLPIVVFAQTKNTLDFSPSPDDISIQLLGYLFGIVDGVLHGTGSQLAGQLFSVFNSAVLFLAGIVLAWVFGKAVVDTAHDGEFLGKNKSTLMVPLRVAGATALLLPKTSGYCTLQVVIMWLVVQGAGVADRLWETTLDYLARGGQIIALNTDTHALGKSFDAKVDVASNMLQSQVCMTALHDLLEMTISNNSSFLSENVPPLPIPDFMNSVNIAGQVVQPGQQVVTIPLPNLHASSPYSVFNGVCGSLAINTYESPEGTQPPAIFAQNPNLLAQANQGRLVAAQQMFLDLASTSRAIVYNITAHFGNAEFTQPLHYGYVLGGAYRPGYPKQGQQPALLSGYELYDAAQDYFGIIRPNLRLLSSQGSDIISQANQFVTQAKQNGWLMAGSYFFKMAQLTQGSQAFATEDPESISVTLPNPDDLATDLNAFSKQSMIQMSLLLGNTAVGGVQVNTQKILSQLLSTDLTVQTDEGFAVQKYLRVADYMAKNPSGSGKNVTPMAAVNVSIPSVNIQGFGFGGARCSGNMFSKAVCNSINGFFVPLLSGLASVATTGVKSELTALFAALAQPGVDFLKYLMGQVSIGTSDPILALAGLGNTLINQTVNAWLLLTVTAAVLSIGGSAGVAMVVTLMPLVAPIMAAFIFTGVMFSYYIPLLPYMLFTFGGIAWFIAVIEAMVAGPLVAFGILYPDGGHETWGKSEPAIMLLLNIFFRPPMMILGFIFGIMLSYVSMWLLNIGFGFITNSIFSMQQVGFTMIFASVFLVIIYLTMTMTIMNKAFGLIHILPDKVLRFLSGFNAESLGQETASMVQDAKGAISQGAQETSGAGAQIQRGYQDLLGRQKEPPKKGPEAKKNTDADGSGEIGIE